MPTIINQILNNITSVEDPNSTSLSPSVEISPDGGALEAINNDLPDEAAISVVPGISNLNLEKSLQSILPNIKVNKMKIEDLSFAYNVNIQLEYKFDFDFESAQELIEKYFVSSINTVISNNPSEKLKVEKRSLFFWDSPPKPLNKKFGFLSLEKIAEEFIYIHNFNIIINKLENNANPPSVFFICKVFFDEKTFNDDYSLQDIEGLDEKNNGKAKIINFIADGDYDIHETSYYTREKEWQGPTNIKLVTDSQGSVKEKYYTYSKLYFDSEEVFINNTKIKSNLTNSVLKFSNELVSKEASFSLIENSTIKVHSDTKQSYPPKIFFDLRWAEVVKKAMGGDKYIAENNPEIHNLCKIKTIKVFKRRIDGDRYNKEAIGFFSNDKGDIQYSGNDFLIEENKYDFNNEKNIRNFIFVDKTCDKNNFYGTYEYSIVFELDNQIYTMLKDKQKKIKVAKKNLVSLQHNLETNGDFSYTDQRLVDSFYDFSNTYGLFSKKSVQEVDFSMKNSFKLSDDKQELQNTIEKVSILEDYMQKILREDDQKLSKTNRTNLTYEIKLGKFEFIKDSSLFLFDKIEDKYKISSSDLNDILKDSLTPKKIIKNNEIKKNTKNFKDEKLDSESQTLLREIRDKNEFFGLTPQVSSKNGQKFTSSIDFYEKKPSSLLEKPMKEFIFDENLSQNGVFEIFNNMEQKEQDKEVEIYYFGGYGENMSDVRWNKLENLDEFQDSFLLCRLQFKKHSKETIADKYFFLNQEVTPKNNTYVEFFTKESIMELSMVENNNRK